MKIGYFVHKYPYPRQLKDYVYGGSIKAAYHLACEETKRGNDVSVFTSAVSTGDSVERNGHMTIYRYGTRFRFLSANVPPGLYMKPADIRTDLVHAHFDIPPAPLAALIYANKTGLPLVLTYHGDWVDSYGGLTRRFGVWLNNRMVTEKILKKAKIIISPSERYIERSRFLPRHRDKVRVIPNGIDANELSTPYSKSECRSILGIPQDKQVILFFGNLSPYKGPEVLLRAMALIIKEAPGAHLVYAGRGTMLEYLSKEAAGLGLSASVTFAGFVEDELKPLYYKASDVFVLPSTMSTESFGIVILEAMACGIPVVASDIGGIPDVVDDGRDGLLVKPNDPFLLAVAILELLNDERMCRQFGTCGREKITAYSWQNIASTTEKVYEEVL